MIKYFKIICLTLLVIILPTSTTIAQENEQSVEDEFNSYFESEEETYDERRIKDYAINSYFYTLKFNVYINIKLAVLKVERKYFV